MPCLLERSSVLQGGMLIGKALLFCMNKRVCMPMCFSQVVMLDRDFFFLIHCFCVANGFRIAKDYEKAKEALEKASKGQELISSYPHL